MANAKTDFSISATVRPDTSQVQRTLDHTRFRTNVTLDIDTHMVQDRINNLFQGNVLNGFERINTKIQTGLRGFDEYGNAVRGLIKYTETFKNAIGDIRETVTLLNQNGKVLGQSTETVARGIQEMTTDTRQYNVVLNGLDTTITKVTKTWTDTAGATRQVIETTKEWTDANGRLNTEIETTDERGQQLAPVVKTVSDNIRQAGTQAQQTTRQVNTLGQSFANAFRNLTQYYLASLPIRSMQKAISETIETLKDFDSALIEFRKVSDLAGDSLTQYVAKLAEMGEATGSTMTAMVEASTQFRKSGFSDEDSATLASLAEEFRNVADEEISAADSASFIIAQMKAFNIEAENAEHILDAVNEVSNNFAVSSSDLSNNIGKVSAALAVNGVKFEEMLGMMTAITEVTRNASTASRGLNMISSRLVQVLDESSSTGKKLTKIYADLGIALKDDTGQMRSTYDILKDLAGQWNTLSGDQQKYIALTSAGARQTQNFVALMENFDTAIRATSTAYNSAGSAAKENERVLDSISKKIEILHSEFQQLVIGDGGLQEFAKAILDIGITLLKFANSDVGKAIITFGLLEVAILSARRALLTLGQTNVVVSAITSLIAGEATLTQVTNFLTEAIIRNTRAFVTSPLFLGSVALAGVVALGYAMKNYAEQLETATKNLKELKDQADSTNKELSNTKTQLEQIHEQIKKNNELKLKLTNYAEINTLEKETSELEKQESALKRQVELLELKLELENKAAEEAAKETYNKKGASNIDKPSFWEGLKTMALNPYGVESRVEATTTMVTPAEEMDLAIKKIEELTAKKEELFKASINELKTNGELSDTYKKQTKEIADLDKEINDAQQAGQKAENTLETILGSLKSNSKETVELRDKINSQLGSWLNVNKEVNQVVDAYNRLKELSKGGAVDLTIRPIVDDSEMVKAGYEELLGSNSYSTTYSTTFTDKALTKAVNFTPILTDEEGNFQGVLSPQALKDYAEGVLNGIHDDFKHLQVGMEVNAEEFEGSIDKAIEEAGKRAQEEHDWQEIFYEAEAAAKGFITTENEVIESDEETEESLEDLEKVVDNLAETLGISATELAGLRDRFNDLTLKNFLGQLAEARQKITDTNSVIDNLQSALETASTALEEYNQNGYLTIDTFQSLMGISAQYLISLINENGQLEINQNTLSNLVTELKKAKIQELQAAEVADILSYAQGNVADMSVMAQQAVANAGTAAYNAGKNAQAGATGFWTLADAISAAKSAADGTKVTSDRNIQRIHQSYQKLAKQISEIEVNTTKAGNAASKAGKKGSGAAKEAKDATKELNKELEETKSKYEKVISWISKQYDKEIDKIKKAKDEAVNAEEEKIKAKEKEKDVALDAIEAEIKALEREKKELKAQKEVLDERKNALKDEENEIVKSIEKRIKVLEKERDALIKPIEERIKALEKERDAITESTQAEIDALTELKEQRQTYWDDQINALKEANKELKDNLELQEKLDALEKAKNTKVKVYKEGQGFVYDVDQNAVQQAQKALDEYLSQKAYEDELARLQALKDAEIKSYDDRLNELKKYKDDTKKVYDQQIEDLKNYKDSLKENYTEQIDNLKEYKETVQEQYEEQIELLNQDIDALERHMDELDKHKDALEEHKDAVEEQYEAEISALEAHKDEVERAYDAEIQAWENYKQGFEDMVNAYEEQQNRLLFEQLTGIKDESNNWMTRLDNLAEFVKKYNELQKQLDTDNTDVSNNASMKEGSTPSSSYSSSGNISSSTSRDLQYSPPYVTPAQISGKATGGVNLSKSTIRSKFPTTASRGTPYHAKGVDSVGQDEIAVVGDSPNQEIVIGSRLNGELMSLDKGTGVVNASSSKSLAGMLNQVGKYGASGFGSGGGTLNNNYNNDTLTINGVTIQGANISSPETFVNGLLNLKAEALQRAYAHR